MNKNEIKEFIMKEISKQYNKNENEMKIYKLKVVEQINLKPTIKK